MKRVGFPVVISPFPHMRLSENKLPFSLCCLVNVNHLVTIFHFFRTFWGPIFGSLEIPRQDQIQERHDNAEAREKRLLDEAGKVIQRAESLQGVACEGRQKWVVFQQQIVYHGLL